MSGTGEYGGDIMAFCPKCQRETWHRRVPRTRWLQCTRCLETMALHAVDSGLQATEKDWDPRGAEEK